MGERASRIHPTAVVDPAARLDPSLRVGPFAVIGPRVQVGPGCSIGSHCVLRGALQLGAGNRVEHHVVLGAPPQLRCMTAPAGDGEGGPAEAQPDRPAEAAEAGAIVLGERNWIREFATVHAGSPGGCTRLGNGCLLMVQAHVAHDCQLGDGVELANGVQLAGHVEVEDHAAVAGLAAVHQFARIGQLAFVGAGAMVSRDVPPFALASGDRARVYGVNRVGLRRRGLPPAERALIKRALRQLLAAPTLAEGRAAVEALAGAGASPHVSALLRFATNSRRGLCRLSHVGEGVP